MVFPAFLFRLSSFYSISRFALGTGSRCCWHPHKRSKTGCSCKVSVVRYYFFCNGSDESLRDEEISIDKNRADLRNTHVKEQTVLGPCVLLPLPPHPTLSYPIPEMLSFFRFARTYLCLVFLATGESVCVDRQSVCATPTWERSIVRSFDRSTARLFEGRHGSR